jgi:hypothetical protein
MFLLSIDAKKGENERFFDKSVKISGGMEIFWAGMEGYKKS